MSDTQSVAPSAFSQQSHSNVPSDNSFLNMSAATDAALYELYMGKRHHEALANQVHGAGRIPLSEHDLAAAAAAAAVAANDRTNAKRVQLDNGMDNVPQMIPQSLVQALQNGGLTMDEHAFASAVAAGRNHAFRMQNDVNSGSEALSAFLPNPFMSNLALPVLQAQNDIASSLAQPFSFGSLDTSLVPFAGDIMITGNSSQMPEASNAEIEESIKAALDKVQTPMSIDSRLILMHLATLHSRQRRDLDVIRMEFERHATMQMLNKHLHSESALSGQDSLAINFRNMLPQEMQLNHVPEKLLSNVPLSMPSALPSSIPPGMPSNLAGILPPGALPTSSLPGPLNSSLGATLPTTGLPPSVLPPANLHPPSFHQTNLHPPSLGSNPLPASGLPPNFSSNIPTSLNPVLPTVLHMTNNSSGMTTSVPSTGTAPLVTSSTIPVSIPISAPSTIVPSLSRSTSNNITSPPVSDTASSTNVSSVSPMSMSISPNILTIGGNTSHAGQTLQTQFQGPRTM